MNAAPLKLLIIDDHALVRTALKTLLSPYAQLMVVAEASNGLDALSLAKRHLPDIILLDIELPDLSGVEIAKRLLQIQAFRIIILTSHTDNFYISQLLKLGVDGYLSKNCHAQELIQALLAPKNATPFIDQHMAENLAQDLFETPSTPFSTLSQRELEILLMLCHGEKAAIIAKQLFLSPKTINTHRRHIFKKMQVKNTLELAKLAFEHKLLGDA